MSPPNASTAWAAFAMYASTTLPMLFCAIAMAIETGDACCSLPNAAASDAAPAIAWIVELSVALSVDALRVDAVRAGRRR